MSDRLITIGGGRSVFVGTGGKQSVMVWSGAQGAAGASGVSSFNSRTGDVLPVADDYSVSDITGLVSDLAAKADDSAVVHLAGTETVTGTKTFSATIVGSISGNAGTVTNGVYTTGAGTVFLAPNGSAASLTNFPTLNQNTTGTSANVTGVVSETHGGTNQSSYATGDMLYASGTDTLGKLAANATGTRKFLRSLSAGVPVWDTLASGDIPTLNQSTTGSAGTLSPGRAINGVAFDGSQDIAVTAAAGTLSGNTLASGVTASSLASVGTLTNLTVTNPIAGSVTGSAASFTGTLVGDVTGTQGATVVSTVGTSSASNVHVAELLANAATNANTASTIVKRDSSGNFTASTITAALSGNATTASSATTATTATNTTNVATTAVSTNATFFPLFVSSSTNGNQPADLGTGLTFNPSSNTLSTTTFAGALSGNASTASAIAFSGVTTGTNAAALHIGTGGSLDATGSGTIAATAVPASGISGTIANSSLTNSGALTVTAGTGLSGGGSVALGGSTTVNLANTAVTAGSYTSSNITVDAQGRITAAANGSGGGGSGTVTSVDVSGGSTGLTTSGGPVTTSGTITLSGTLVVANGGTGLASTVAYALLAGGTTTTGALQQVSGVGTAGQTLTSQGASALPTWTSNATLSANPTNPTMWNTGTSVNYLMLGLNQTITPTKAGILVVDFTTEVNGSSGRNGTWQIRYGTGTAPSNQDASTGTASGAVFSLIALVGLQTVHLFTIITGLSVGTTYWIDVAFKATTATTVAYIASGVTQISAFEP